MYIDSGGRSVKDLICVAQRGRSYRGEPQHFEESPNPGKTNCLTTVAKDNLIMQRPRGKNKGAINTEKSPTLSANSWQQNNLLVSKPKDGIRQINPSRESEAHSHTNKTEFMQLMAKARL